MPTLNHGLLNYISNYISEEDNINLTAISSKEEIKEAVFILSSDSTAGQDGYNGTFFQHFWDIIKYDIIAFIRKIFIGKKHTKLYSHFFLVLIPKVDSPTTFFWI